MLRFARNLFSSTAKPVGLSFSRPLVILQSDDWGRVGVRDHEGYELLRAQGLRLGERPYDLYTLETADDVAALASVLKKHHDSNGRTPCVVMNFCTANLDFNAMRRGNFDQLTLLPLARGLPGSWQRKGLINAYQDGIGAGVFYPALHGLTQFCPVAIENALTAEGERARLLRLLWEAEAPYIYWRMPWVGFEYWNPEKPRAGFLPPERQRELVRQGCTCFSQLFGTSPFSACAPGYRSNRHTLEAWSQAGVKIAQSGTGSGLKAPHMEEQGVLHLYRTIDFEPSQREPDIDKCLQIAGICFARGMPLIVSLHAINFHSSLKDFRTPSLAALDRLLTELEAKYPGLLYLHDRDLYEAVIKGAVRGETISVSPVDLDNRGNFAHQEAP
jgi:hypothetical protein